MKRLWSLLLLTALLLCACSDGGEFGADSSDSTASAVSAASDIAKEESDLFTDRDYDDSYDESGSVHITLSGDSASADSDAVRISGTTVRITEEATYVISGTLDDGMLVVDASDTAKVQLVFDGVQISSGTSAALYVLEADKVFLTLAEGTENALSNGGEFVAVDDNNIDGALFSKQDLTVNGAGSLTVTSPAGHGIVCKDDLVITGGVYIVYAAGHGIDVNDSIRIADATLTVDAGKDGIHAENNDDSTLGYVYISDGTLKLEAEGDGISAGSTMQIEGGSFDILSGGGSENGTQSSSDSWGGFMGGRLGTGSPTTAADSEDSTSMKGLKAGSGLLVRGGTFAIDAADDGVHSNADITVEDGSFTAATGDDGFHADETLTITDGSVSITAYGDGIDANGSLAVSGGYITVCGPTQGDTSTLDYDTTAVITGGTFIGTGASGMAQSFSEKGQGVVAVSVGNQSAGTFITLTDSDGNVLLTCEPALSFAVVILSSADVVSGQTYTVTVGNLSGECTAS